MKGFFKMLLASVVGVFIAMFLVWIVSMVMMVGMLSSIGGSKTMYNLSDHTVLQIDLDGSIADRESKDYMAGLLGGAEQSAGLDDILKAIKTAK
jgi:protease-4